MNKSFISLINENDDRIFCIASTSLRKAKAFLLNFCNIIQENEIIYNNIAIGQYAVFCFKCIRFDDDFCSLKAEIGFDYEIADELSWPNISLHPAISSYIDDWESVDF